LDKFKVVEVKGTGLYGPTLKVRSDSNIEFAMKVYKKAKVIEDFAHESVHMLRTINVKISHNLIAKTYRIYNDSKNIYFLNRYVGGESLRDCLSKNGKLPLSMIRHFSACMINILEYLHCKRILWR
jgi:serine/threonine protein kinase